MQTAEQVFRELLTDTRKYIETLMVVEDKNRRIVPFRYNAIQADANATQTGMDIWVKPSSVGFSTERINNRLVDTLINPGTNTVLVAYEDFITQRLLSKVNFSYNHLASLGIPNFPEIHHDSDFQKTFRFTVDGKMVGTSSIYIASARSKTAGRAEVIHHLLLDEHAFYVPEATERIIAPAMARVPPGGTVDSFSTPNGEDNEFHDWYKMAKEHKTLFTSHFYPWYMHEEYNIKLGDPRIKNIPETDKIEFGLSSEEELLVEYKHLSYDQIRWRRWMSKLMEGLRRSGETRLLFKQEFPEDDVTCFLAIGNAYYDSELINSKADKCYPAGHIKEGLHIWFEPEKDVTYQVSIDPGQAKITQSAINVMCWKKRGEVEIPVWCARDAGLYTPEVTVEKAKMAAAYYNNAMISWEANSHGLAITALLKSRRNIYLRKDIVSGKSSLVPGWLTTSGNKDYMLHQVYKVLDKLVCHDIELMSQLRNVRQVGNKIEVIGASDVMMSLAIALVTHNPGQNKRGYQGKSGWKW